MITGIQCVKCRCHYDVTYSVHNIHKLENYICDYCQDKYYSVEAIREKKLKKLLKKKWIWW